MTGNLVAGSPSNIGIGIFYSFVAGGAAGSVSGNTIMGLGYGITVSADGVSVTSNKIVNTVDGIAIGSLAARIQGNSITKAGQAGIEFNCLADPNVLSNTITDVATGIDHVPGAVTSINTYFNVGTIKSGC